MSFQDILKGTVDSIKGGVAGTIMARDGIAIQNYVKDGSACDMDSLGVEYARILEEAKKVSSSLKLGDVEEMTVSAKDSTIVMRLINKDYFIAIVFGAGGNLGKAKYFLKRAAIKARKEF